MPRNIVRPTPNSTGWAPRVIAALKASGQTIFTLDSPIVKDLGLNEEMMRRLCSGSGGFGIFTMESVWLDVEPTAHVPSGKKFSHYQWRMK